jgi:N,N'-diacetylchitobiose transport system permease protein
LSAVSAPATAPPAPRRRSRRRRARRVAINVAGALVFAVMTFPVYWMVSTSFKQGGEILSFTPQFIPTNPTLRQLPRRDRPRPLLVERAQQPDRRPRRRRSSRSCSAFLAALALAKFRFHGRSAFVVVVFGVQMVPLAALVIPLYITFSAIHQVDKLSGVVIAYVALVLPFCVWTLRGFIGGIPKELEEARWSTARRGSAPFVRIMLPLVGPGLVATSIFAFIQAWNEYIIAYVCSRAPTSRRSRSGSRTSRRTRGTDWGR